jgi:hypothetical protein
LAVNCVRGVSVPLPLLPFSQAAASGATPRCPTAALESGVTVLPADPPQPASIASAAQLSTTRFPELRTCIWRFYAATRSLACAVKTGSGCRPEEEAEMTNEELENYANQYVRLVMGGRTLIGQLIVGFEAQTRVKSPYAIRWHDINRSLGTNEERLAAIPNAEEIESIEIVDESAKAEIEDAAEDAQTPG